jgi:hypothetical protein
LQDGFLFWLVEAAEEGLDHGIALRGSLSCRGGRLKMVSFLVWM